MPNYFAKPEDITADQIVTPIYICRSDGAPHCLASLTAPQKKYVAAHGFQGRAGQAVLVPDADGSIACVLYGAGSDNGYAHSALLAGGLSEKLSAGFYKIASKPDDWSASLMAVAWGMGAYQFGKYMKTRPQHPTLVLDAAMGGGETVAIVRALHKGRDLINTPACDMGPVALQDAAQSISDLYGARLHAVIGEDLLSQNYPMIHAVGRAAHEAPRLVEMHWGEKDAPLLALVGKGITFDTGGLSIKSAGGMRLMKKDMGGAAHALALAEIIMANKLPVRLHVLLAIAENAVSANAFRPGDVLTSRQGLSVEIDNTDAEGRLVLGDALTRACEENPDLIIDFATLTGAARVALGPNLAPFFSNRQAPVQDLLNCAQVQADPFWHMPLWEPYMNLLSSPIADMKNVGSSFAGAVTAALFLQKFLGPAKKAPPWMHFDVYGWNPTAAPARPKGGEVMTVRAVYHWLKQGGMNGL